MKIRNLGSMFAAMALALASVPAGVAAAASGTRLIPSGGTTSLRTVADGSGEYAAPEFGPDPDDLRGTGASAARPAVGRSAIHSLAAASSNPFPPSPLPPPVVGTARVAATNPELGLSTEGLNLRQQRLANGGNQFTVEPPDQALCVGNGFVVESVNSVLRVFSAATGAALSGVQDLNTFFGYAPAINRSTGAYGADVIDPICTYDPDNQRFIVVITTLHHQGTTSAFSGRNTIDVAVSNSSDPTGAWTVYYVPAQNDGTEGTPNHGCTLDGVAPGPCFQDYPHIGGDANGIYVTTNEYDLYGPLYNHAQIFAFSKAELAAHPANIHMTPVENLEVGGTPGWTVWPATSPAGQYETKRNGTEYLMSTISGDGSETGNPTGTANKIGVWALSNTKSLNTASPSLSLSSKLIDSSAYVFPPKSNQKPGDAPLRECINDTTTITPYGPGCWQIFFNTEPAHDEVISSLDSGDSRMQQTWYTNGKLYGAAGTAVKVNGVVKAGIVWFQVEAQIDSGDLQAHVSHQNYLALAGNNLTYPAIAMGKNGRGVIAFSVTGNDYYPSAGYATIDESGTVGTVHVAALGKGVSDGFTSYKAFVGNPPRTRWGDYGAAVTDGNSIWIASEYIGQTCSFATYYTGGFGGNSCGGTRVTLGNWDTRLSKITP